VTHLAGRGIIGVLVDSKVKTAGKGWWVGRHSDPAAAVEPARALGFEEPN